MENPHPEQEAEDVSADFLLKRLEEIPLENVKLLGTTLQRCRSTLAGRPGSGRLLGPETLCPSCSTPWLCGQYRAELRPRPVATKPLRRLLNKRREGRPMGLLQTRLLDRFLAARDTIVIECKLCEKVTEVPIVSRSGRQKSNPLGTPAGVSVPTTPAATPVKTPGVTPGTTPATSGRRRSKARDRNAGLVIPESLRTPSTPATPSAPAAAAAAASSVAAGGTPELGQSPAVRARLGPGVGDSPAAAGDAPEVEPDAPIPLKKTKRPLTATVGSGGAGNVSGGAAQATIPLKKGRSGPVPARPDRASGKGRTGKSAISSPSTPAAPVSSAEAREKQRRLQKILAQADCRSSNTGLMAFLSEL
ncbi:leucine-rich repeat extensin-like protein 5 [Amphibalanus amphitrite]|uniref:leucine-rich repeat extensin-like protein 5 n=1 Tax=Amphibalanus amphitrite TaxID=1232801 RepID=UPI001C903C98|nr:leucine-rich repeat extensin-like protein 5 [Amphibalanus amphitrite]XP_043231208.1 leucine-rich repeat extensin-like protein 5 [Amphibalanus amphitrite]XP_043231209.1 leucine-rich repeat extensin-like protein 5 [Amphibalanus amphitrite]